MIRVEQTVLNALDATIGAWKRQEKYSGSVIHGAGDTKWAVCSINGPGTKVCGDCPVTLTGYNCVHPGTPMTQYQQAGLAEFARASWQWFLEIRKQCTARRPISEEIERVLFGRVSQ